MSTPKLTITEITEALQSLNNSLDLLADVLIDLGISVDGTVDAILSALKDIQSTVDTTPSYVWVFNDIQRKLPLEKRICCKSPEHLVETSLALKYGRRRG